MKDRVKFFFNRRTFLDTLDKHSDGVNNIYNIDEISKHKPRE
jgi:hypothetical protein